MKKNINKFKKKKNGKLMHSDCGWFYSKIIKEHFFKPRNFLEEEKAKKYKADGIGVVGSPLCGDMMKVWIKVDKKNDKIKEMKWQTFGCASAIATTSMLSLIVSEKGGMRIEDALKIKPQEIIKCLGGMPAKKIHCSVLGDRALRKAINNYFKKSGQFERIMEEDEKEYSLSN